MKRLLYPLYVLLILIILIPKEKLYFTLESVLAENTVFLSGETLNDRWLYLDVEGARIMVDDLEIGSIERIRIAPWVVYNRLSISSVSISPLYQTFVPGTIEEIAVSYSLLHPLSVRIEGRGDFGECRGEIDLVEENIRVVFEAVPQMRNYPLLVSKLRREPEGLVYESDY